MMPPTFYLVDCLSFRMIKNVQPKFQLEQAIIFLWIKMLKPGMSCAFQVFDVAIIGYSFFYFSKKYVFSYSREEEFSDPTLGNCNV